MKRTAILVGASAAILLLGVGVWGGLGQAPQKRAPGHSSRVFDSQYPEAWKITLVEAKAKAAFPLLIPSHPAANDQNFTAVYVRPDGSTATMQFPAPKKSTVRQEYLEVFLLPWGGGEPADHFAEDMTLDPVTGKSLYSIEGIPAEGTLAHSPDDIDQANPAYLRFVYKGLEVQISGGDSLDLLLEVAKTVVA